MQLPLFIARRYLFSPKKQHVINIISIISTVGITIGTAALVIVLSVFNGIDLLLDDATGSFTPDLTLSPARGKFAPVDTALERRLAQEPEILHYQLVVEEIALAKFGERLFPVIVKGVEADYDRHAHLSKNILIGRFALEEEGEPTAILGAGIVSALKVRVGMQSPLTLYYPDRTARSLSTSSLNSARVYPVAIFSAQQEVDNKYLITGIALARRLFDVERGFSKIEISLRNPGDRSNVKERLSGDPSYKIEDKYEVNASFYAMMRSEKLVIFLLLLFILGIASFNIIASISMLIIDKREDLATYRALGMSKERLVSIFRIEGLIITLAGASVGLFAGFTLCFLQERFGLVSLGEGSYLIEAYPVKIVWSDILIIMLAVLAIGSAASHFPVKYLVHKFTKK
ncbi:MAG: FtsX-like permease family protein [Odoribacteraceae bacterium]|jgi:lipoprotein-releasing system permease protein|nr:FtsX-like permease family protein [Odoribacteraceae bacterium]